MSNNSSFLNVNGYLVSKRRVRFTVSDFFHYKLFLQLFTAIVEEVENDVFDLEWFETLKMEITRIQDQKKKKNCQPTPTINVMVHLPVFEKMIAPAFIKTQLSMEIERIKDSLKYSKKQLDQAARLLTSFGSQAHIENAKVCVNHFANYFEDKEAVSFNINNLDADNSTIIQYTLKGFQLLVGDSIQNPIIKALSHRHFAWKIFNLQQSFFREECLIRKGPFSANRGRIDVLVKAKMTKIFVTDITSELVKQKKLSQILEKAIATGRHLKSFVDLFGPSIVYTFPICFSDGKSAVSL